MGHVEYYCIQLMLFVSRFNWRMGLKGPGNTRPPDLYIAYEFHLIDVYYSRVTFGKIVCQTNGLFIYC
uniref:Uncharacterized protein n=1 Tax=Physcomitrium patens TaxID=3218 RepID=A0A7I3ZWD0_PHYPA